MTLESTLGILFFIRKDKARKKDGACPIYLRITVNGQRAEYAVKRYIDPDRWLSNSGKAKGTSEASKSINDHLLTVQAATFDAQTALIKRHELVTAEAIRNLMSGKSEKSRFILDTFRYHNQVMKDKVGSNYAVATLARYDTTLAHIEKFLSSKFYKSDFELHKLDHAFITELERYFKQDKACNHNTTMKYIKNLKRVVHFAVELGWLDKDPFQKFKTPIQEVKRDILTREELTSIENKEFDTSRLDQVRDIFVFSCYTGLAYVDIEKLTINHIVIGIDGKKWIHTDRTKTGTKSHIPLLPKVLEIIEKYKKHPESVNRGRLLPVLSNQKMNAYLKEIAGVCHINKILTFHLARHTFATTVTLLNGVPIETVGAMLGHKNLRTTQIYSKVVDQKISKDMNKLIQEIESNDNEKNKTLKSDVS